MKNSRKALTIVAAIGLLVVIFGVTAVQSAAQTVTEDTIEWSKADGSELKFVKADASYSFYVQDGALETITAAVATFSGSGVTGAKFFDVANSKAGVASGSATNTNVTVTVDKSTYATTTPATTPWIGTADPVVKVGTLKLAISTHDTDAGTATTQVAATATTTVAFSFHTQDTYATSTKTSATAGRIKVTSTSDLAGEFAEIKEVASVGSSTADPQSKIFLGSILLSGDAETKGTNNDGVWISDGDTVTVSYLDKDGNAIDTDTVVADLVKPTIGNITPKDGSIVNVKNPEVNFEVTDTASGMGADPVGSGAITMKVNSVAATLSFSSSITDGARAIFVTQDDWRTKFGVTDSLKFTWEITATDVAGNSQTVSGTSLELTIDKTLPTLDSASTGRDWDAVKAVEKTGVTTAVRAVFSEDLDASEIHAADFTVAGVVPSAAVVGTTVGNKNHVYLTVAAQAADLVPIVKVTGTILDLAGNKLDTTSSAASTQTADDELKPTITTTISSRLTVNTDKVKVTVEADEKLATLTGLTVSINGPSGAAANGLLDTTSPTTGKHEGTETITSGATQTGIYGLSIQAKDVATNPKDNLTKVTDETPTFSGTTVTLANGPIADMTFNGVVDASDISALTDDGAAVTITAVDASKRTITVSSAIATGSVVKVTYHYVKTDVFEIDNSAPTVTYDPVDDTKIQDTSPFIRLTFDEDEYPGDTFKKVTLTKAEVLNPDLTTTDLLAAGSFKTSDSIEFIWAASDLALGKYTLTISAKDEAGNKLTDSTSDFTVEVRALRSIALRPGWNLISLPGAPADSAIGTVIAEQDVDVVLTYDPAAAGGWLTAVRGTDGNFVGTLTTVDSTRAYWVHTDTFDPIKVDIPGFTAGSQVVPPAFDLGIGWNLIPVSSLDLATTAIDADEYFTGLTWSRAYGYDNANAKFANILPATTATLTVGQGYWLYLTKTGTLVP